MIDKEKLITKIYRIGIRVRNKLTKMGYDPSDRCIDFARELKKS
jgi:hypothetical protein